MEKTYSTLDVLNICAWYKQARENEKKPLNDLPLKTQWTLKKNITAMNPIAENFSNLQKEAEENLRSRYMGDDKSYPDKDEQGQDIRKIKDEFMAEFQKEVNDMNIKLNDILEEKVNININPIYINDIIDEIGDKKTNLSVDDLEVLDLMSAEEEATIDD